MAVLCKEVQKKEDIQQGCRHRHVGLTACIVDLRHCQSHLSVYDLSACLDDSCAQLHQKAQHESHNKFHA